jgi:hypothetical protein
MQKQFFDLYINSKEGQRMLNSFTFTDDIDKCRENLQFIFDLVKDNIADENFESFLERFDDIHFSIDYTIDKLHLDENKEQGSFFEKLVDNFNYYLWDTDENGDFVTDEKDVLGKQGNYRLLACLIPYFSLILYMYYTEYEFFPIFYKDNFDEFTEHCINILGIDIPESPLQKNHKERVLYYNKLCEVLSNFRKENNLSKEELCACVYGFAPFASEKKQQLDNHDLPEPTRIWLTGANKNDYTETLETANKDTEKVWACNETTKRGDIVIVYALAPHSHIHSIWRAANDGYFNPFDYYCSRVKVTDCHKITPITFYDLKHDAYTSQMPIVRKNLNGINGIELSPKDYSEILRILREKEFDISVLPKLYVPNIIVDGEIKTEKDVEEKLLIPLLEKLGYNKPEKKDWVRQYQIEVGRKEKAIPDFVFFPTSDTKHNSDLNYQATAPFLIEAKYEIKNIHDRFNAFRQACSYARPLTSKIFGVCDKNGIRIYEGKNGYFSEDNIAFEDYWGNLNKPEIFLRLKKLIGRDVVVKLK